MQIRLLLGPAGSGKTYCSLEEVRRALRTARGGLPLVFIAPKQATYQIERQLLGEPGLAGYTRLRILSFERLAQFIFQQLGQPLPQMLDEEGRVMVLRSLLARKRQDLKLFRASARLTGFAQQLSQALSEFQREQLTPESLRQIGARVPPASGLALKLADLATLLQDYIDWLQAHGLGDVDSLLPAATELLSADGATRRSPLATIFDSLWLDGFAEFSRQELALLCALMPYGQRASLAFCLDRQPSARPSWLSSWSVIQRSFELCREHIAQVPGAEVVTQVLARRPEQNRFADNPVLEHLERCWSEPEPYRDVAVPARAKLRLAACVDLEAEAVLAAREILAHVRRSGRYRQAAVLVRDLETSQQVLQRVFARYEIPHFVDRRESVAHHPLAELSRGALRAVTMGWEREDLFAALKTGLVAAEEDEIDRLENEALARGWRGKTWQKPLVVSGDPELTRWASELQQRLLPPFQHLALALAIPGGKPTGAQLAQALRDFWRELDVEKRLERWAAAELSPSEFRRPGSIHATVWDQMNTWLDNLALAFPAEPVPLREWLPILEAGLGTLSVGVIPPALDQVLIGAIDRSRNPDLKLAIVLGMNEGVFPARPQVTALLTDTDRQDLEKQNVLLGSTSRHQLGRERFFAYIACTRARERLVVSYALRSGHGGPMNPSPFVSHLRQLFPTVEVEQVPPQIQWCDCEHLSELAGPLFKAGPALRQLLSRSPAIAAALTDLSDLKALAPDEGVLSTEFAARLYGPVLRTSVSRLEQFAACPFKFFVHSGLRAEERKKFELDVKEQGSFQHEVLALFHEQLRAEGKRWRDLTPQQARNRIGEIGRGLAAGYRDGLLQASDQTRFMAATMTQSLQDFVAVLVDWMHTQYQFDPVAVELAYGSEENSPPWMIDLGESHRLELHGRIDRVDLCRSKDAEEAFCVVLDYKSSRKQLDPLLLAHGLQLQLLAYLNVLRHWPAPRESFGVNRLVPVGVFYVNLRGRPGRESNRRAALESVADSRKLACRHSGRFDLRALRLLDGRADAQKGDQFNYRLNKDGQVHKGSLDAMTSDQFQDLLEIVEKHLEQMGRRIYAGDTAVSPFRKNGLVACDQCDYHAICRIDPWTHHYRVLRMPPHESVAA